MLRHKIKLSNCCDCNYSPRQYNAPPEDTAIEIGPACDVTISRRRVTNTDIPPVPPLLESSHKAASEAQQKHPQTMRMHHRKP